MDISFINIKFFRWSIILQIILLFIACNPDLDYIVRGYTQKIIVEGTVVTGKNPEVYLSLNVPLWKDIDSTSILDHVIRYAKVSVSDGTKTEILTSKWDKTHFTPYVYKGTEIVGVEGKTYTLKVEYSGYTVYSQTTIPIGTNIDLIESFPAPLSDTLRILALNLYVDKSKKTSFRISTKKQKDKRFVDTPILFNDQLQQSGMCKFNVSPHPKKEDASYHEGPYFAVGDVVDLRICAIDSVSTAFFKDLSLFSNTAGNIFINEVKPLKSNITEPGFGIWYGGAVREYKYVVK